MEQGRREQESRERELSLAARELSRAAEDLRRVVEITEVQREAVEKSMAEFWHFQEHFRGRIAEGYNLMPWMEGLPDEEAAQVADVAVRQIRAEFAQDHSPSEKLPTPDPEEVKEWEERREERRRREGYSGG